MRSALGRLGARGEVQLWDVDRRLPQEVGHAPIRGRLALSLIRRPEIAVATGAARAVGRRRATLEPLVFLGVIVLAAVKQGVGQSACMSAAPTWSASRATTLSCTTDGRTTWVAAVSTN